MKRTGNFFKKILDNYLKNAYHIVEDKSKRRRNPMGDIIGTITGILQPVIETITGLIGGGEGGGSFDIGSIISTITGLLGGIIG